jgi:hypothetical protein
MWFVFSTFVTLFVGAYLGAKYGSKAAHAAVTELRKDLALAHTLLNSEIAKISASAHSVEALIVNAVQKDASAVGAEAEKLENEAAKLIHSAKERLLKVL